MSDEKQITIHALFDYMVETGTKTEKREADREPEGTYTRGYKNVTTTFSRELGGYQVVATRVDWLSMSLSADQNGTRFALKVHEGDEVAFSATREGANVSKNFGSEERYLGTDVNPAGEWMVIEGEFPPTLQAAFV